MFTTVIRFAIEAHRGQNRKGTRTPYIVHPLEVALILQQNNASREAVYAGMLHDVLEDTDKGEQDIRELFGEDKDKAGKVTEMVIGVTEPSKLDQKGIKHQKRDVSFSEEAPWRERKEHTIKYLAGLKLDGLEKEIKLVACADKLSNIRSMLYDYENYVRHRRSGNLLWRRFNKEASCRDQEWYYRELVGSLADLHDYPMYLEFAEKVEELFGKAEVREYRRRQKRRHKNL